MSTDDAQSFLQLREAAVLAELFPRIKEALAEEDIDLCVFDSQQHSWLPQTNHGNWGSDLKPDGFILLRHFGLQQCKPALQSLFPCVRSLIEGKQGQAFGNDAMGQVVVYAEKLAMFGVPFLNVRLF